MLESCLIYSVMKRLMVIAKLLPCILVGLLFFICMQTQSVWFPSGWRFWVELFIIPISFLAICWKKGGKQKIYRISSFAPLLIVFIFLLLALASSFPLHKWFYFLRWYPSANLPVKKSELVRIVGMATLLMPLFISRIRKPQYILVLCFIVLQLICFYSLIETSGGVALYRTDHPSFMFRLFEFTRTFPQLINYNPYWNGGTEHFVSVTSGTAGPGLLTYPLLRFVPIHVVYTYVVGLVFIIFVPWFSFGSIRAIGGDKVAASAGGLLSLGVSQQFFLWMMHYGTIGASLSSAMILPVSALAFRVVKMNKCDKWTGVALVLSTFFLLLWPPGAIMGVAVAVTFLLNFRQWTWQKWKFLLICALFVFLLYSQWIWVQVFECDSVMKFVLKPAKSAGPAEFWLNAVSLKHGFLTLVNSLKEGRPALIFLGLGGVFVASRKSIRMWFGPIIIVLALITGLGEEWKHNSQLARISIPLLFVAIAPASMIIGRLLRVTDFRFLLVRTLLVSLLSMGAYNVSKIYENQGYARFTVLDNNVKQLVGWIKKSVPNGGRVLFAGKCVHAYGRGNVAYLPVLTGREMMADDYYGFPVGTIEYEYPPRRFRKSWKLMQLFFDAYNVTDIVTYHDKWKKYFKSHPEYFKHEKSYKSYNLTIDCYSIDRVSSMLWIGDGDAIARFNHIDVKLEEIADEVVLKYNWMNHLKATAGVEIFPYEVDRDITLIGVRPHGVKEFGIIYRNIY